MKLHRLWPVALLLVAARSASAQIGVLDKVFDQVSDMNAHLLFGKFAGANSLLKGQASGTSLRGVGFEISLSLGDIPLRKPTEVCMNREKKYTTVLKEVTTTGAGMTPESPGAERTYAATKEERRPTEECPALPSVNVEMALGYSQLTGFQGRTRDLRTSIEELPSLTTYFTLDVPFEISPYLGLRAGLTSLKGMRFVGVDTLPPSPGAGSSYHVGIAPGIVIGPKNGAWGVFAEYAWTYRRLQTIDWSEAKSAIPADLLGEMKFDTWTFAVGLQVEIGSGKDK